MIYIIYHENSCFLSLTLYLLISAQKQKSKKSSKLTNNVFKISYLGPILNMQFCGIGIWTDIRTATKVINQQQYQDVIEL